MPRRERPAETQRSEHWLRVAVNDRQNALDDRIRALFGWNADERIDWRSPIATDQYAEYFDQSFLDRLEVRKLDVPLSDFWPASGPRWDGLARTASERLILVEAKAYVEEAVDYRSKASAPSLDRIRAALARAKAAFGAADDASWESPFYQYANRLAHLYFLRELNGLDAHLLFLCFADAGDVPRPCTEDEWRGAIRVIEKSLGLGAHRFEKYVGTLIWSVQDMIGRGIQSVAIEPEL